MGKKKQNKKRCKVKKKRKEQKIFMPKSEKSKKTGRVEAYTFGEAKRGKAFPW